MKDFFEDVFRHDKVSTYLEAVSGLGKRNGIRQRMAKFLRCHPTHISQVVKGKANLSAEFAFELSRFLGHSDKEAEYFELMARREAAGTASLAAHYEARLKVIRAQREQVSEVVEDSSISGAQLWRYYCDWTVAAVHIALTIPKLRTLDQIAKSLELDGGTVQRAIATLATLGLVVREGDGYKAKLDVAHLSSSDPAIVLHHQTWRMRAMAQVSKDAKSGIHYAAVASVSEEDLRTLRTLLLDTVRDFVGRVKASPAEALVAIDLDFFRLSRPT